MDKTVIVTFDGQVLRPDEALDLVPNTRYVITIQDALPTVVTGNAWDLLEALAGTVEAPPDWSAEHDHYLYGTPKHHPDEDQ